MSIFQEKLKTIIKESNEQDKETAVQVSFNPNEPLFNVHKRTLPVEWDTPVMFGLTLEDAQKAMTTLRAKEKQHPSTKSAYVVYYDIVAQSATDAERSVYYNSIRPQYDVITNTWIWRDK